MRPELGEIPHCNVASRVRPWIGVDLISWTWRFNALFGRDLTALTLVVTMSVIGAPLPTSAAGEESSAPSRVLTLNGQPLSQLLDSARAWEAWSLPNWPAQEGGQITGVAVDVQRKPLANHAVRLRSVSAQAIAMPVVVVTNTNAEGRFSFSALSAGQYVVDLLIGGQVVATSEPIAVKEGGMTFTQVGGDRKRKGALFWTAVGAGAGAAVGLIAIAGVDCEHPENLCPVAPIMGGITGALMGLLFGLGR